MGIKQHITYYNDFSVKTYTETENDVEIVYKEFDKKGRVIFLRYPNGDYGKWKFDKNGHELYHETNAYEKLNTKEFYWIKTKRTPIGLATRIEDSFGNLKIRRFDRDGRMTYEEENGRVTYDINKKREIDLDNSD